VGVQGPFADLLDASFPDNQLVESARGARAGGENIPGFAKLRPGPGELGLLRLLDPLVCAEQRQKQTQRCDASHQQPGGAREDPVAGVQEEE
jgi:hypothetical protein